MKVKDMDEKISRSVMKSLLVAAIFALDRAKDTIIFFALHAGLEEDDLENIMEAIEEHGGSDRWFKLMSAITEEDGPVQ